MPAAISSFPMITEDMLKDISIEMSEYSFCYMENSKKNLLDCVKISDDSVIYMLNDSQGIWNTDEYNFSINRQYKFNNYNILFGENGIACRDSVLGIAVVWTSADSKQRGIIDIGEINNTYEELNLNMEYFFDKAQLRGDVEFTTIIYIKNPGNPLSNEQHLANSSGCIVAEIDKLYLRLDGTGSMFPIYEINDSDKALWYLNCEWEDPRYDDFAECVSIYINTGHKNYKYLDKTKRTYDEQLLKEIMASALTIVITKLRSEMFWESIVSGTAEFEDGSIVQAVSYFVTTLGWNITKSELLSYSIRKFFDERM
ncbi:hypothetical protein FDB30_01295 [Clostridium botulinum]|uniref:Uncharacterized protein n=1 Tax=Clostridium botulinum TaxID=1491 RepID=A0A846K0Y6_CLOBO|nr:hypothetical protein [Clostridium botulinum]NFG28701.1 hypothetical protein [Clostridium botulinum]NFG37189.1 hypothetical protein [Clostridium botulinum]NFN04527.1 hypothetical protein [Clostridium botulinum]NFN16045.1 hypothetical protein [Clostridium botulinum]NFN36771.1 hypothetical protein [Clostridium botulinum]